jgi:uncharacterized protein (DUF2141 family)
MSRRLRWAAPLLVCVAAAACGFAWTGCGSGRTTSAPAPAGQASAGAPRAPSSATGASGAASQPASRPATKPALAILKVTIKGLRNHKGQLIFGVFRSAEGFPNIESKSVYWETKEADADAVTFTAHLPPGRYGASVLHDENRSGEMNRNFANAPTEGYGVTNNPKPAFRAATFNEAAFDLPASGREMTISVQYF